MLHVIDNVRVGDPIDLRLKPDNPYDPLAVAAYHEGHHIGYVAPGWRWVAHSLAQGNRHDVVVSGFETDIRENLAALAIEITVVTEPPKGESSSPPLPGTAPWAPRLVHAPLPRWPVVIPLSLLAALIIGVWLLMDRGLLPAFTRFAGGP